MLMFMAWISDAQQLLLGRVGSSGPRRLCLNLDGSLMQAPCTRVTRWCVTISKDRLLLRLLRRLLDGLVINRRRRGSLLRLVQSRFALAVAVLSATSFLPRRPAGLLGSTHSRRLLTRRSRDGAALGLGSPSPPPLLSSLPSLASVRYCTLPGSVLSMFGGVRCLCL